MFASLALENFRNHRALALEHLPQQVVLCGENGVGKTNLLEALSLFSAGRGLRAAALDDICPLGSPRDGFLVRAALRASDRTTTEAKQVAKQGAKQWALQKAEPDIILATHFSPSHKRRRIFIDEQEVAQSALREHVSICWLLPQMGSFFTDGIGARRAWLDRLVARQDPEHDARLAKHAHFLRERLSVLLGYGQESQQNSQQNNQQKNQQTSSWLAILEQRLAEQAVAVSASRANTLAALNALFKEHDFFAELTRLQLSSSSKIDEDLQSLDSLQAEQQLVERLYNSRDKDRLEQRNSEGAHRARLSIENLSLASVARVQSSGTGYERGVRAELCSCGEQKLMLLSLLLAEALLLMGGARQPSPPVLLLDDFPAHLDKQTQARVLRVLARLGSQCFYSATEPFIDCASSSFAKDSFSKDSFSCELFLLESNGVQRKAA